MAFFNIFKLNFLKFYYRIFNKGTDFTPTIQQENFFQGVWDQTRFWTLKLCKIPITRTQSENQTPQL
ncbi:hypothetical protein JT254_05230 [Helicobacter pylori]|nr:hypothetical protein [Helicobacter pylori]